MTLSGVVEEMKNALFAFKILSEIKTNENYIENKDFETFNEDFQKFIKNKDNIKYYLYEAVFSLYASVIENKNPENKVLFLKAIFESAPDEMKNSLKDGKKLPHHQETITDLLKLLTDISEITDPNTSSQHFIDNDLIKGPDELKKAILDSQDKEVQKDVLVYLIGNDNLKIGKTEMLTKNFKGDIKKLREHIGYKSAYDENKIKGKLNKFMDIPTGFTYIKYLLQKFANLFISKDEDKYLTSSESKGEFTKKVLGHAKLTEQKR